MPRLLFVGSKPLAAALLRALGESLPGVICGLVTFDDRADARTAWEELHLISSELRLPLWVARDRKHSEHVIQTSGADAVIVCGWYWLIGAETLRSIPGAFIGLHNSLLPAWRGSSPLVWQIIAGADSVGCSLFSLTQGMDEGDVWATVETPIGPDESVGEILDRLNALIVEMIRVKMPGILAGNIRPRPQDHSRATYCALRIESDAEIDWRWPARQVHDFVRAQSSPYPGAFTWHKGLKLRIWKTRIHPCPYHGTPGQIAETRSSGVTVVCGAGTAVIVTHVGLDDAEPIEAIGLLRSVKTRLPEQAPR